MNCVHSLAVPTMRVLWNNFKIYRNFVPENGNFLNKKKIIKLVILKYTRNIYLIFSLDTTPGVLILIAIY